MLLTSSSFRFNAMIIVFECTAAVDRSDTFRHCETSAKAQKDTSMPTEEHQAQALRELNDYTNA